MNNDLTVTVSRVEIRPGTWATLFTDAETRTEITILEDGARIYSVGEFASTSPMCYRHDEILTLCHLTD